MKYSVLGFNQEVCCKHGLDMSDLIILNWFNYAIGSPRMQHIYDDDGNPYVWGKLSKILEDYPILNIKERMLSAKLTNLKAAGFLKEIQLADKAGKGSRAYFAKTELFESLLFTSDQTQNIASESSDQTQYFASENSDQTQNIASQIIKYNYNKVNNKEVKGNSSDNEELQRIKKELSIDEPTENPELSESYKSFLGSATNKKTSKRPNRFQQCINLIDEFTDDESVRTLLVQYLRLRFESASAEGKPIYVNQWRGLLTKLMNIVKQGNDIKEVIQQSIDRGYRSFFPVNSSKKYAANNYTNEPLASEAYKDIPDEERDPRFGTGEVF